MYVAAVTGNWPDRGRGHNQPVAIIRGRGGGLKFQVRGSGFGIRGVAMAELVSLRFVLSTGYLVLRKRYLAAGARCGMVSVVVCSLFAAAAIAQPEPSPPQWLQDAELTAVSFIDADRGWAVGDRGVIWHTSDGGRSWKLQNSAVTCRLEAVQFLDADNGFVVGGWTQPYTHETHGIQRASPLRASYGPGEYPTDTSQWRSRSTPVKDRSPEC